MLTKLKPHHWVALGLIAVTLTALGALPSFSYVRVTGPDGNVTVQNAGYGGVHVQTPNADVRVNR